MTARPHTHPTSAANADSLRELQDAERAGGAALVWRSPGDDRDHVQSLADQRQLSLGRSPANSVVIADREVSRVHAELELLGDCWVLLDDGISSNGTFVNGSLIAGRRRLRDGDIVRLGATSIHFHEPADTPASITVPGSTPGQVVHLSDAQRGVLEALCRPYADGARFAAPASNRAIAEELSVGVSSVKAQLRRLFTTFAIPELPQNHKRARLAELAIACGAVAVKPESDGPKRGSAEDSGPGDTRTDRPAAAAPTPTPPD